jgi:hypothetical protein
MKIEILHSISYNGMDFDQGVQEVSYWVGQLLLTHKDIARAVPEEEKGPAAPVSKSGLEPPAAPASKQTPKTDDSKSEI